MTWTILGLSFLCLAGGVGLYLWAVRRPRTRYLRATNVIAWVLVALFPTLVLFSVFPDSSAHGSVVGITVTGAFAGFLAIFMVGKRFGERAIERDQDFEGLQSELTKLRADLALRPDGGAAKHEIGQQRDLVYKVLGKRNRDKSLVILTGELGDVSGIDAWVSSENTNMQMARYYDGSVSAFIRYKGARKDGGGHPIEDVIAGELRASLDGVRVPVEPASVFATSGGELEKSHGVKRVYHVAAVSGQVGHGYTPVKNIAECVPSVLVRFDADATGFGCSSILFPLLGLGTAKGDRATIQNLITAAAQYLSQHAETRVKKLVFIARYYEDLAACRAVADSCDLLESAGGSAESLPGVTAS